MKIVHILNTLLPSGAEVMLETSAKEWIGCEKWILATDPEEGSYAAELKKAGYHIKHIYHKNIVRQYRAVYRFLKEQKFDVVHCHRESQSAYYLILATMAGVKRKVHTVHNVFKFTGLLRVRRIFTRWLLRRNGVRQVAICKDVEENERKRFHNPCYRTIYNWCNSSVYHYVDENEKKQLRSELRIEPKVFCIVSVGNCSCIKNHTLLLQALAKQEVSENYHYYHIGAGETEEEEKRLCRELDLEAHVTFMGRCNPERYVKAADLYVMPSLHEGFSIAALEAIHTGMHTLFTKVPGLGMLQDFGFPNTHFCELDADKLKEKIDECHKMFLQGDCINSEEQSKTALELFGMQTGVRQYLDVYGE
ncbi:MAG: glycosyltransferase [Clostridiales bacterium]|nr:glycosyltransferase [Clostridiales bacterium]